MKYLAVAGLLGLLLAESALADTMANPLEFLTGDERTTLDSKGELTGFGAKPADLALWQRAPFSDVVRAALPSGPSTIAAEGLFILDIPGLPAGMDLDRKVVGAFTAFSTMKGLQVYSASLRKMETFIYDSWQVDNLESKTKLPDPSTDVLSPNIEYTMYQKEEQTGDTYSRISIHLHSGYDVVTLNNLTELKWFFVQLVPPEKLKTVFVIIPFGDKVVLYGITVADTAKLLGLENTKRASFFYRMKALAGWFGTNLRAGR